MWFWVAAGLVVGAAPEVRVTTLAGDVRVGKLVRSAPERLTVEVAGSPTDFPCNALARVALTAAVPRAAQGLEIEFADGGKLYVDDFALKDATATLTPGGGGEGIKVPIGLVRAVRMRAQSQDLLEDWRRLRDRKSDLDLLVVKKAEALDFLEGTLKEVNAERMPFELDGEIVGVNRTKVFGVLLKVPPTKFEAPIAVVQTTDGGRLPAAAFDGDGDGLNVRTVGGLGRRLEWERIAGIDFSGGKIVPLGELPMIAPKAQGAISVDPPPSRELKLEYVRLDANCDGEKLRLGGREFARGIGMRSRCEVAFELGGEYRRFLATAGIDDAVGRLGAAEVRIFGDDKLLFAGNFEGTAEPQTLDLPVAGCRRLKILVDFGRDLSVGDLVDFGDARVIK